MKKKKKTIWDSHKEVICPCCQEKCPAYLFKKVTVSCSKEGKMSKNNLEINFKSLSAGGNITISPQIK